MRKAIVIALVTLGFSATAASVCYVPQPRLVCAEYFKEQVVVIAKLVRTEHVEPNNDIDFYFYTLSVQKILRGTINPTFRVWEENSSGRAGFGWMRGTSYLLFLSKKEDGDSWVLDGCGNSAPLSKAGKTLKAIERINSDEKGGLVSGSVVDDSSRSPLAGISVVIRGQEHVYQTSTTKDGTFKLRVPPGTYTAKARRSGWLFQTEDLSYEDPRKIEIDKGSCAQIQFVGHQVP